MYDLILVRYGEMTLKKKNYRSFLNKVNENIKNKCKPYSKLKFFNTDYRFYIYLNGEDYEPIIALLDTVVGLYSYSLCKKVESDFDAIANLGIEMLKEEVALSSKKALTFKVETNRGDKNFPYTSIQISQEVAKRILPNVEGLTVDVRCPDVYFNIDLRTEGTYIFVKTKKGLGGYPAGIAGSGLSMMSGGIDSPVATFLALRKGVNVTALHFASPPYTSDMALQKVVDLLQVLANYTPTSKMTLLVVPFTKVQEAIHEKANPIYLVTLMRRAMYKIAEAICKTRHIDCIINGESIGQVASQTLESIGVVNAVTSLPIIRPLATFDKEEIINIARNIHTYDISVRPYEDCCTVFVPEHPVIKPRLDKVIIEEEKCNLDELLTEAIGNIEIISLDTVNQYSVFKKDKFTI